MANERLVPADVHTHVWHPDHMREDFRADLLRSWPEAASVATEPPAHAAHAAAAGRSVVLAFDAPHAGLVVPDEYVAAYVRSDERRLIGFSSIDPRRHDAIDRLRRAVEELGMRGLKLAPTYQGYDPRSPRAMALFEAAAERGLPVLIHQGVTFVRTSVMAYALPHLLDEVATRLPELRMVVAHLGHPWIDECLTLIRKHPNLYSDVSGLTSRPVQMRNALISAVEYRCASKLLFGTDFPFGTIAGTADALAELASPREPHAGLREAAAAILQRDAIAAIGL